MSGGTAEGTSLSGLTAVVTGAGRGLGRAEALELARLGANVVVNDFGSTARDGTAAGGPGPAEETAAAIRAAGGSAVAHAGDVADSASAGELVTLAVETYGQLDILVNNAGILRDRMIFSMSDEEWDSVLRVHLRGHFATSRAAAIHWRERSKAAGGPIHARIVNTSSESFIGGSPGQPNYAAAKGGIVALTTSCAAALAKYGVRANAIAPRARTRMTDDIFGERPSENAGMDPLAPEHVAPLVGYLASPASDGVNGQLLVVHGGMVAVIGAPQVVAKFDSAKEAFTPSELDETLSPWFADHPAGYANTGILALRRGEAG
ncbi:3-oxoacyl-ACP reductase [Phaeacidiphilus oryzae]|uniref:3-oxoacyl-ACP reductase n=1 Tax=Phaeacidiphilus oryzae TaxID=348818 RepID=UPI000563BC90|nr:3-oxoacyl-ACP reductase [Phaeacidiphilus oryzae]